VLQDEEKSIRNDDSARRVCDTEQSHGRIKPMRVWSNMLDLCMNKGDFKFSICCAATTGCDEANDAVHQRNVVEVGKGTAKRDAHTMTTMRMESSH
jgi:hypothetical protein